MCVFRCRGVESSACEDKRRKRCFSVSQLKQLSSTSGKRPASCHQCLFKTPHSKEIQLTRLLSVCFAKHLCKRFQLKVNLIEAPWTAPTSMNAFSNSGISRNPKVCYRFYSEGRQLFLCMRYKTEVFAANNESTASNMRFCNCVYRNTIRSSTTCPSGLQTAAGSCTTWSSTAERRWERPPLFLLRFLVGCGFYEISKLFIWHYV